MDNEVYGFIDLALVILDGSHRDLGTTYKILEQVVLECIEPDRVIIAINQADMAMKGKYPEDEIAALPADVKLFHVKQLHVPGLDAQRCILWMKRSSPC